MKKLFLIFTTIFLSVYNGKAQKRASFQDINGSEIAIILNISEEYSFEEFFLFQYVDNDFSFLKDYGVVSLVESNKSYLKLRTENKILTLTLDKEYKNPNELVFYGYGLSKRTGKYRLIENENPKSIIDVLLLNNQRIGGLTCHSGGPGSSECSTTGSDLGQIPGGGGGCSVKCNTGFYSCCDGGANECRCLKVKKTVSAN